MPLALPLFLKKNLYLLVGACLCFILSFCSKIFFDRVTGNEKVAANLSSYISSAEEHFAQFLNEKDSSTQSSFFNPEKLKDIRDNHFFLFQYSKENDGLHINQWSTNVVMPDSALLQADSMSGLVHLPNGYYIFNKVLDGSKLYVALIPVKWDYVVSNDYLKNNFATEQDEIATTLKISTSAINSEAVKGFSGETYFYLDGSAEKGSTFLSPLFLLLGLGFCLYFFHIYVSFLAIKKNVWLSIAVLFFVILTLRIFSYYEGWLLNLRQFTLFDPGIYGSNAIHKSLGDLLLNVMLALWVIVFSRYQLTMREVRFSFSTAAQKWLCLVIGITCILAVTYLSSNIVRSLIADSQISFEVLDFFSLNIYSGIGFIILCTVSIAYYYLCTTIVWLLRPAWQENFVLVMLITAVQGLVYLSFRIGEIKEGFDVFVLVWLLLFLFLLRTDRLYNLISKIISSRYVFWIFFFSVSISAVVIEENRVKELDNRQHYAEVLALKSNPTREALLNSMLTDFRADVLADNFFRFYNKTENYKFKDSLVNNNYSGYKNLYKTEIFTFNNQEEPLYNVSSDTYNDLNAILTTQAKPTGIPGLYRYDLSFEKFSYLIKKIIINTDKAIVGYVFIRVVPRNTSVSAIYPELFGTSNKSSIEYSSTYAFAIYSDNKLIRSHNDYPFVTTMPKDFFAGKKFILLKKNNHSELWYKDWADKAIVIVKENRLMIESVTLFSYLFCIFLVLMLLGWIVNVLVKARWRWRLLTDYFRLTIRDQIHGTIIFFSIFSFLVIGAATILFFIYRYEDSNRERLSDTQHAIEQELQRSFKRELAGDSTSSRDSAVVDAFSNSIRSVAELHSVDVNFYDLNGNLTFASLAFPYEKGIVSNKINPVAWYHLRTLNEVQFFQKEEIGRLSYLAGYVPVLDAKGNTKAYLNIPYFTSQSKLRDEISNFLVAIINLNAFIFLIAGIVAWFITNKITDAFLLIAEKMKRVNIGIRNESISWHRDDEIGRLVEEYNRMVEKLDDSARTLARTEREGAWREMAQQVAHEIKNPLTPMKLSMQFLQKAIQNDAPNVKALSASVATTLVEQIDHLSEIADEFSRFAEIGKGTFSHMDLNAVLGSLKQLFSTDEAFEFQWDLLPGEQTIYADKTQINRLFTNLFQNAKQSIPGDKPGVISVKQYKDGGKIWTLVGDNGSGIPLDIQEKIFTPNFTTKSSGSGLGLAMSKRIVELCGGTISFTTSENGTEFLIGLPQFGNIISDVDK